MDDENGKIIYMDKEIKFMPHEIDEGNCEYKWKFAEPTSHRLDKLTSQMKFRLYEGNGKAIYIIGVRDNGVPMGISEEELNLSIGYVKGLADNLGAEIRIIRIYQGNEGLIATIRIFIDCCNLDKMSLDL